MNIYHLNILHDENPASHLHGYKGVRVEESKHNLKYTFNSGDPIFDWDSAIDLCINFLDGRPGRIIMGSSLTHFLQDVAGYRTYEDQYGIERIEYDERDM